MTHQTQSQDPAPLEAAADAIEIWLAFEADDRKAEARRRHEATARIQARRERTRRLQQARFAGRAAR